MKIINGDSLIELKKIPENSVDSVVCDPPYGLSFMGKKWDYDVPSKELWVEAMRVLKPGGHLLSFAGSKTYHRMAVNIEDAGFEIRDQIMWVYGSGFPKSHNIGKAVDKLQGNEREVVGVETKAKPTFHSQNVGGEIKEIDNIELTKGTSPYEGWGTALKPAHEPIVVARKPLSESTIAENVLEWGTGGINIDGCRVGMSEDDKKMLDAKASTNNNGVNFDVGEGKTKGTATPASPLGRFPANFLHDGSDEVVGLFPESKSGNGKATTYEKDGGQWGKGKQIRNADFGDSGSASRFFYCAKASKKERYVYLTCNCQTVKLESWPKQDQNLNEQTDGTSPEADTYDEQSEVDLFSNTPISGKKKMVKSLSDTHSTTSTTSKQTTDSAISSSSMLLNTNESTEGVNLETENGGNPAQFVKNSSKLQPTTGISPQKDGHCTGVVVPATSAGWYRKSVCVDCGSEVRHNGHPTQKPEALMQYLVRLVTPKGGTVLDPFAGSFSTGKACVLEGFNFIGIELDADYCAIGKARIEKVQKDMQLTDK